MPSNLAPGEVIGDIEFELLQGVIVDGELALALRSVEKVQNQLRINAFRNGDQAMPLRDILSRQFQINEMLLALLRDLALNVEAARLEQKRIASRPVIIEPAAAGGEPATAQASASSPSAIPPSPAMEVEPVWPAVEELANLLGENALQVELSVRPVRLPLIGSFLTRLRAGSHSLALYYVLRLGWRQTAINQVVGRWLLTLLQRQQQQSTQLQTLVEGEQKARSGLRDRE